MSYPSQEVLEMMIWMVLALFAIACCFLMYVIFLIGKQCEKFEESLQRRMSYEIENIEKMEVRK